MGMGNPNGVKRPFQALEKRLFQAMLLLDQALNQSETTRRLKVARQTVSVLRRQYLEQGPAALRASRVQAAAERHAAGTLDGVVTGRSRSARLPDAAVDLPVGSSPDPGRVRSRLPRRPRLEGPAGAGLEPATPGRPGARAQRRSDPHLEAQDLAGPKKKPAPKAAP